MRHTLLCSVAVVALTATVAAAQDYPSGPVNVIVPFNAGSGPDTAARLLLPELEKIFDERFIITNIPGAGGTIGATELAGATPDGQTLGFLPVGTATTQPHLRQVGYGADSWEPICMTIQEPMAVGIAPNAPYAGLNEVINAAKGGTTITSGGPPPGSLPHIAQAAVANAYGVEFRYVPQEGGAGAATQILGGNLDVLVDPIGSILQYGLRPVAILDGQRSDLAPDLPTIDEIGGEPLRYSLWFGLFAVAGTSDDVVSALDEACGTATGTSSYKEAVENANRVPRYMGHDEFAPFFQQQFQDNGALLDILDLG